MFNRLMLRAGIVGLPNVGKSTLFNAVTRTHKAAAENYPFCTIEPEPWRRHRAGRRGWNRWPGLPRSARSFRRRSNSWTSPASSKARRRARALGNKFLSHIREVDAMVQVVRFEDPDIARHRQR